MSEWIKDKKPKQHHVVEILLADGTVQTATFLKDVNKYVRNVNTWKIITTGRYVPDIMVEGWREI